MYKDKSLIISLMLCPFNNDTISSFSGLMTCLVIGSLLKDIWVRYGLHLIEQANIQPESDWLLP